MSSEIYQVANAFVCRTEIVEQLCVVLRQKAFYRFEFDDDFTDNDQVGFVFLTEGFSFLEELELGLGDEL